MLPFSAMLGDIGSFFKSPVDRSTATTRSLPCRTEQSYLITRGTFFSLPLVGRVDASEASIGMGVFKKTIKLRPFQQAPPPDRRFAHSRCKASAFLLPKNGDRRSPMHAPQAFAGEGSEAAPQNVIT